MLRTTLAAAVVVVLVGSASAAEMVGVSGSSAKFPATLSVPVPEGKPLELRLTGTALRTKLVFNVYAVASYVDANAKAGTAEELIQLDGLKQLHLVIERDLSGKDLAGAFKEAIARNHPADAFADEMKRLSALLEAANVKKGDRVILTHVPGVGLHAAPTGRDAVLIPNVDFARAVWGIYFGENPVTDEVKKGLLSRL
jgi:hypothetical protein